jgi:hypothetical protein
MPGSWACGSMASSVAADERVLVEQGAPAHPVSAAAVFRAVDRRCVSHARAYMCVAGTGATNASRRRQRLAAPTHFIVVGFCMEMWCAAWCLCNGSSTRQLDVCFRWLWRTPCTSYSRVFSISTHCQWDCGSRMLNSSGPHPACVLHYASSLMLLLLFEGCQLQLHWPSGAVRCSPVLLTSVTQIGLPGNIAAALCIHGGSGVVRYCVGV